MPRTRQVAIDASIAISFANRKIGWAIAAVAAVAAGAIGFPIFGVALALGIVTYAAIKMSKPHAIIRGRILSPRQHHRVAVIVAGGILGITALFSGTLCALDLANGLENRLHDALRDAHRKGELTPGQIFEECELACAQARVTKLSTPNTLGIAKLSGFALHDHTIIYD
jgi:hypothetical protein